MSIQIIRENSLSKAEVDNVSEQINELLEKSSVDKPTRMRIRYIIEDMILNVCNELGEETKYKLCTGKTLGRQFISFIYEGECFDPCSSSNDPSENWSQRIMSDMGLSPTWHYKNGVNTLELKLKRKKSSIKAILMAIVFSLIVGFAGVFLLPSEIKADMCELLLKPFQKIFFNLISVFASIMILMSVSCGIFNMGDMSSFSKIGKVMFRRFIGFTLLLSAIISAVCYFIFPVSVHNTISNEQGSLGISAILSLIYDIVPTDIITPFSTGNAMQIVFISIIIGIAILLSGDKTKTLRSVAEEINSLTMSIMSGICRLLPFYILSLFIDMIWSDQFKRIAEIWKPFTAMVIISIVLLVSVMLYISIKYKVSFIVVAKKLFPSFFICITTASTISAFNQTIQDSIHKFGVDENLVKVVHPIRAIVYMPAVIIELIVIIFSMAQIYEIEISIPWIIIGMLVSTLLTIAVPPIPGGATMLFGIIFSQMGIPTEAMVFAVTCNTFFDFLMTAVNSSVGMLEYVLQADKLNMLDKEVLRNK